MPKISIKGKLMPESPIRKLVPYAEDAKKTIEEIESITQPEYKINMIAEAVAIRED